MPTCLPLVFVFPPYRLTSERTRRKKDDEDENFKTANSIFRGSELVNVTMLSVFLSLPLFVLRGMLRRREGDWQLKNAFFKINVEGGVCKA